MSSVERVADKSVCKIDDKRKKEKKAEEMRTAKQIPAETDSAC